MLRGKVALVTGASRGIGREIAVRFAREGADVAIVYNGNETAAEMACEEVKTFGRSSRIYKCNVADFAAVKELVAQVIADFGGVDILVNNAGIVKDGLVMTMSENDFDDVINTNLKGSFNTIKQLYPHFARKRAGRIINITSVSGLMGNAGQANYSSAKAGLVGLTKTVAKELAARNVTCNAIAPGFIATDMTGAMPEDIKEKVKQNIPMKKMGAPSDIAALAAFLASDEAGYITGEIIKIDGGLYI